MSYRVSIGIAAGMLLALSACKKDEGKGEASPEPAGELEAAKTQEVPSEEPADEQPAADSGDFFLVEVSHSEAKPDDPVQVKFGGVEVVQSTFDPKDPTGGTAKIELSIGALDSGIPKRNAHLLSADYFDAEKHPKATIEVKEVKAREGDTYAATAQVTVRGVKKSWPVEFEVVDRADDAVTIEAEHKFTRADFEVGKAEGDSASNEVVAKLRLTIPAHKG